MTVAPTKVGRQGQSQEDVPGVTRPMTFEEYLASPEEMARYDIIDGFKVYRRYGEKQLTNPTREHQRILGRLLRLLQDFEAKTQVGEAISAPCDVQITRRPLRNRQPDLLFISNERLAQNPPAVDPKPLAPAPELVVEIVSPSDKPAVLAAKIADYRAVDVQEVWVVRAEDKTVEILRLSVAEIESTGLFRSGQTVFSGVFDGLTVPIADIFAV